jgi:hypothetical protein
MSTLTVQEDTAWIRPSLWKAHKKKDLLMQTWAMDIRPVEICPLVWGVQIWNVWFQQPCLCEKQSRWTDDLRMCGSQCKALRWSLLVTLSVIYLEFKAHLTSMATTAFCSNTPSYLVCA